MSEIRDGFKDVLFDLAITDRAVHKALADLLAVLDEHTETQYRIQGLVHDHWRSYDGPVTGWNQSDAVELFEHRQKMTKTQLRLESRSRLVSEWTSIEGDKT